MTYLLKIIKTYYLLFFSLLFIQLLLIKSENFCPFKEDEDLIKYYVKGVIPNNNISQAIKNFKNEFIHCINGYSLSTYIIKDINDYFYQNSGIFIGSSIDLGKLTEDFINSTPLKKETKAKLLKVSGKFGEEAELLYNSSEGYFTLSENEIDIINEEVYTYYLSELKNSFVNEKIKSYTLEMCLLTFFVKFYKLDSFLSEARNYVASEQYYMLSFYFLNIKNDKYIQNKIWSLLALSSTTITFYYHHIGFYMDSQTFDEAYRENIRTWMKNFIAFSRNKDNFYTIGNITGIISSGDSKIYRYDTFNNILDDYSFRYYFDEKIDKGIKNFEKEKILEFNNSLFNGRYYQRHLIIFLNEIPWTINKFKLDYFYNKGIQVTIMFKSKDLQDYQRMAQLFDDKFNLVPFYYYEDLIKDNNYSLIMNSQISFYIEPFKYDDEVIEIKNIGMRKRDNIQTFKIIYKRNYTNDNITDDNDNDLDFYYFHVSLIYNNEKDIQSNHNNNANVTFYVSHKYPYTDVRNYDGINYCLNDTVSSDYKKSPFINFEDKIENDEYFYITIIGTDIYYSLRIELLKYSDSVNYTESNGVFGILLVQSMTTESIATFSEKCIQKKCQIDFFSLMKYYTSGLHLNDNEKSESNEDLFNQIFDLNMFECLYKNYYCPFFNLDQKGTTLFGYGPYLGYGINLPTYTENDFFKEFTPLNLINKLFPFLLTNYNSSRPQKTLENNNVIVTYEELLLLNQNYLKMILQQVRRLNNFDSLPLNIKLSLFLRAVELGSVNIKYVDELHNGQYYKYLTTLMESATTRNTTFETLNFQMLLIQATTISKLKKCLLSIVVGKPLLYSTLFQDLVKKFEDYRIGLSYYDEEKGEVILAQYFTEENSEVIKAINSITEESTISKMEDKIDVNLVLKQQYSLLKYFDYGIKKCIIIVSTHSNDTYSYNFNKPETALLENLYDLGVNIFDYSDRINFFNDDFKFDETKENSYNFFNTKKNEYIQYVPYIRYSDMADNYLTLFNIINKYPIPINKIKNIYLDLHANEEIIFEFNLEKEARRLMNNNLFEKYNQLRLTFDNTDLEIFASRKTPFPNNYSFENNYTIDKDNNQISYDLKDLFQDQHNSKLYIMIKSQRLVDNLYLDIEICEDEKGECMRESFYFKFYLAFLCVGILIFFYGVYICFCEITFKKESNIFDMK